MKYLISIVGPTASGKTDLAVKLAAALGTSVISADSRQVFRGMDIGTAKATAGEMRGIRHYCIDELNPDEVCNAGWFGRRVSAILEEESARTDVMVMAGGSGLYLHAVWKGFDEIPPIPEEVRMQIVQEMEKQGIEALAAELQRVDAETFATIDASNPQRITRALEVFRHTGIPISAWRKGNASPFPGLKHIIIGLDVPREELYDRINRRVDRMMELGLVEETKRLVALYGGECEALNTLGYKELIFQMKGVTDPALVPEWWPSSGTGEPYTPPTLADAAELIRRNSRRFAKRQMTWFRRYPEIHWFPFDHTEKIIAFVKRQIAGADES